MGDQRKALTPDEAKTVTDRNMKRQADSRLEDQARKQDREAAMRAGQYEAHDRSLEAARKAAAAAGYASMSPGRKLVGAILEPTARIAKFALDLKKDLGPLPPDPDRAEPYGITPAQAKAKAKLDESR